MQFVLFINEMCLISLIEHVYVYPSYPEDASATILSYILLHLFVKLIQANSLLFLTLSCIMSSLNWVGGN